MPRTTSEARTRDAFNKRRRGALGRRPVTDKPCAVPSCKGFALEDEDGDVTDCCYEHSLQCSETDNTLPNDGILDWTAIEIAAQGAREVGLTWVEKEIVIAMMLVRGASITEARERVGVHHQSEAKTRRAEAIAAALNSTRNGGADG